MAAIDGSKFKAVNARDKNFTRASCRNGGSGRGEHRALSVGAGDGGPSGRRVGGSQVGAAEGQDRLTARADAHHHVELFHLAHVWLSHDIVVKQHGGTIEAATEAGVFTEFMIRLPRAGQGALSNRGAAI